MTLHSRQHGGRPDPPRTRAEAQARKAARRAQRQGGQPGQAAQPWPPAGLARPPAAGDLATGAGFAGGLTPSGFPVADLFPVPAPAAVQQPAVGAELVQPVPPPSTFRALLKRHGAVIAPVAYITAAEIVAAVDHFVVPGELHRLLASIAWTVGAWTWALVRTKGRKPVIRRVALWSAALAGLWWAATGLWTPYDHLLFGWPFMQALFGVGALLLGGKSMYDNRHQPVPPDEPKALPPPMPAYLAMFRARFCYQGGELAGAVTDNYTPLKGGFSLDVHLHNARGNTATVIRLQSEIAKLYDTALDQVTIEYHPAIRSEARARVTVITSTAMEAKPMRWDGKSTYTPRTGLIRIGRFMDTQPTHWALNRRDSGAASGIIAGLTDSGKTGTAHRVIAEIGLAKMCGRCNNPDCDCAEPQPERIALTLLGDPQRQPFSVWRGRAPLTAWGPEACVELLRWGVEIGQDRAAVLGSEEWWDEGPDGQPRSNVGRGWFDLRPGRPLIFVVIDEWPKLTGKDIDPELAKQAIGYAQTITMEFRKTGIGLILLSQMPDLAQLGDRAVREMLKAFNTVAHRTDALSNNMLGIEGDPTQLPKGVPGLGFTAGPDNRPSTKYRTEYAPEYNKPGDAAAGPDIRHLAEVIADDPVRIDEPVVETLRRLGWTGPGMVLDSDALKEEWAAQAELDQAHAAGQLENMNPLQLMAALSATGALAMDPKDAAILAEARRIDRGEQAGLPATDSNHAAVLAALAERGDAYDAMVRTGLDALAVNRAIDVLTSDGRLLEATDGQYIACP